jgi:hypothetical protein
MKGMTETSQPNIHTLLIHRALRLNLSLIVMDVHEIIYARYRTRKSIVL